MRYILEANLAQLQQIKRNHFFFNLRKSKGKALNFYYKLRDLKSLLSSTETSKNLNEILHGNIHEVSK